MYSRLSRHSTARGSSTEIVPVGPSKVKACKYIIFSEGTPEVEIMNTEKLPYLH